MKVSEIRDLSIEELNTKAQDIAEDLFKLKFKNGIRQLENTATLNELRKNIARVKTVISEKRRNAA